MKEYKIVVRKKENKTLIEKFIRYSNSGNLDSVKVTKAKIDRLTDEQLLNVPMYKFTDEQKKTYNTLGGAPHLDGSYTVFGEVVEGMEVVDKIAAVPRNKKDDRPITDIHMKISIIK